MQPFAALTSRMVPLLRSNIDTDQIIPASYLKVTSREGLGKGLFAHWRFADNGALAPEFVLNRAEYEGAQILVAGDNFGCGSSREHAPWALLDYGFRVVVSTSFADIFRSNAGKNGILAAVVSPEDHAALARIADESPDTEVTIDLAANRITSSTFGAIEFEVEPFARHCLLTGTDQIGYLLDLRAEIEDYEARNPQRVSTLQLTATQEP